MILLRRRGAAGTGSRRPVAKFRAGPTCGFRTQRQNSRWRRSRQGRLIAVLMAAVLLRTQPPQSLVGTVSVDTSKRFYPFFRKDQFNQIILAETMFEMINEWMFLCHNFFCDGL